MEKLNGERGESWFSTRIIGSFESDSTVRALQQDSTRIRSS